MSDDPWRIPDPPSEQTRLHHAQAGALASLAEQLEDAGFSEAAALADREAAIYSTWALWPTLPAPDEPMPHEQRAPLIQMQREMTTPTARPAATTTRAAQVIPATTPAVTQPPPTVQPDTAPPATEEEPVTDTAAPTSAEPTATDVVDVIDPLAEEAS